MEKSEILTKEELAFLGQLINTLEQAEEKLEQFYKANDFQNLKRAKELIHKLNQKIEEILR